MSDLSLVLRIAMFEDLLLHVSEHMCLGFLDLVRERFAAQLALSCVILKGI